eukprot:scaffold57429_cov27-Tisochrysis_lutea.AAC.10
MSTKRTKVSGIKVPARPCVIKVEIGHLVEGVEEGEERDGNEGDECVARGHHAVRGEGPWLRGVEVDLLGEQA